MKSFSVTMFVLLLSLVGQAKDLELGYPELQVSPSATKRLELEFSKEKTAGWEKHLPIEISALSTFAAGLYLQSQSTDGLDDKKKDNYKYGSMTAMGIGAGWLAISAYLTTSYRPYEAGFRTLVNVPNGKSMGEQLTRERMAEETLMSAGSVGRKLKWLSFASNLLASAFVASAGNQNAAIFGGVASLVAFAPVVFPYSWETTADVHNEYKKRIYGPVTFMGFTPSASGEIIPTWNLSYRF